MSKSYNFWLLLVVCFIFVLWVANLYFLGDLEPEHRGTFGDMFGGVNALFSGLAFAGVIYTILLQKEELREQRKELSLTRRELEGQKLQMELQNKTLNKQSFENTFFQMLRLHNEIIQSIDIGRNNHITGRDCFQKFYYSFQASYGETSKDKPAHIKLPIIKEAYSKFYNEYEADLGHYFRSLYGLLKMIDNSNIHDKKLYTNIVRSQLSTYELIMLFYNGLSNYGSEKLKPLIEKYTLLKHIQESKLYNNDTVTSYYEASAKY